MSGGRMSWIYNDFLRTLFAPRVFLLQEWISAKAQLGGPPINTRSGRIPLYRSARSRSLQEQHFGLSATRDDGVLVRRSPERGSHQTMEQNQRPATLPKLGKLEELVIKAFASPFFHVFNYGHSWHSNKHSTASFLVRKVFRRADLHFSSSEPQTVGRMDRNNTMCKHLSSPTQRGAGIISSCKPAGLCFLRLPHCWELSLSLSMEVFIV